MKCSACKFWEENPTNPYNEDDFNECIKLPGSAVDIELKTGWDGGYVSEVRTHKDFFCAYFEERRKMSSYKIVKKDEKTGIHIAKVTVGGSVWFLKDKNEQILYHDKYRDVLANYKLMVHK